jgi:hypothetical protein
MDKLSAEGQIKVGDRLKITGKNSRNSHKSIKVKEVVDNGYGEEIIINKKKNYYFMTRLYLDGASWCKSVEFLDKSV